MTTTSLSGYVYYVSFIDDFSHKTWIYFLKTKSEVFNKFKEFKALVENISEKKIKILRSDNGGEFTSDDFKAFCKKLGLRGSSLLPTILNRMV
jgi:transposase InsO family protein